MTRPRNQARPGEIVGLVEAAGAKGQLIVTAGENARLLHDHHGAVGSDVRTGDSPLVGRCVMRWLQPAGTSRRSASRARAGAARRRRPAPASPPRPARRASSKIARAGDRLEVAELVRDVGDAVGRRTPAARAAAAWRAPLHRRSARSVAHAIDLARGRLLERRERHALHRRQRQAVEKRLARRQQRARRPTTRGRARRAPCRAGRGAAAARRGSWTRC